MAGNLARKTWPGEIDVQLSESEADLHRHLKTCEKNPGHADFIPVDQFTIEHLPENYRDPDLFEFIKVTADLTVRICGTYVTLKRLDSPYKLADHRGTSCMSNGTGRVCDVILKDGDRFSDDEMYEDLKDFEEETEFKKKINGSVAPIDGKPARGEIKPLEHCICERCKRSNKPSSRFGWVKVITARHVIFNNKEAESSICRLFYDSSSSSRSPAKVLTGVRMATLNKPDFDWCWLKCVTCDADLLSELAGLCEKRDEIYARINAKFPDSRDERKLTVIVSHPHGCSKQVSVGRRDRTEVVNKRWTKYWYTTATCPGSSGATVIMLGKTGTDDHVHSGGAADGLNYSGVGDDYEKNFPPFKFNYSELACVYPDV